MKPSIVSLIHFAKAFLFRDAFHGALESPIPGASISDSLVVSGWTFSRRAEIAEIQAFLGPISIGRLVYGVERPDVAHAFARLDVGRSGYQARIPIDPSMHGRHTLSVRVIDRQGNAAEYRRLIVIQSPVHRRKAQARNRSPNVEIEQAAWRGDRLSVEGWAVWPGAAAPLMVDIELAGMRIGRCQVNLSRPDIIARFPEEPGALCSGFRWSATTRPAAGGTRGNTTAELRIELLDRDGGRVPSSLTVTNEVVGQDPWTELDKIAAGRHVSYDRTLTALNWGAGLETTDSDRWIISSPPLVDDSSTLPYADRSVDVVVLAGRAPTRIDEATRVATTALVVLSGETAETVWLAAVPAEPSPTVSIIIPVYGQLRHTEACLRQLQSTLPQDFVGEILIVDDMSVDGTLETLARWRTIEPRLKVLRNDRNLGFVESCNRGARAAVGDVLMFLNNDTLPQPGWLPPLLAVLRNTGAGAVGAKLVYPNGVLQEAGGVIFSDATGWNFGKGDTRPDAPLFNAVREVDYCSAAALATPRRLFLELGGFDTRFSPAYYEDTDYCFSLRARGYRVLYQPASMIVHTEGATCGVDEQRGAKSSQPTNRIAFGEKWREPLRAHRPPPEHLDRESLYRHAVRDPAASRVLVWAPTLPEYDRESGSRRVYDMVCYLREAGWAVTYVAESATGGKRYVSMLERMGVSVYAGKDTMWAGSAFLADPRELMALGGFDLAIFHFWWIAERHLPSIRRHSPTTRVTVDSVDLHFLRRARSRYLSRSSGGDVLNADDAREMMRELNVYASADAVLTVSAKEADLVNDVFGDSTRAHVVADAEDLKQSPLAFEDRRGLLFLGNFRHAPNVEALTYLAREIVPRLPADLLAHHPISIVGNDLSGSIVEQCGAQGANLRLVGWVPSVEPYLERALATLVPLQHGAGTKRKTIQAAMAGTPSVSTSVGIEGLGLVDGSDVLVADNPDAFAAHIVRLAGNRALWERLAGAGRATASASHGREVVRRQFMTVLARVMGSN